MVKNNVKKIGFVVSVPFQWYVHKNVFFEFGERAEVIVDMRTHQMRNDPKQLESIIALLDSYGAKYKVLNFDDYNNSDYLELFFRDYECLVSLWENGCMSIKETNTIRKVNLPYGVGKELTITRKSKGIFDLILAYGPRDRSLFALTTTAVAIGIPKFDDWYNNIIDKRLFDLLNQKLDKSKKTVLYLPTHSDLSSLDTLKMEIKKLSHEYNIIVKLHYYNSREDPTILNFFDDSDVILFNDDTDLITLFKFADLVLSDNSSVIFDALLADIPTVVADFWDDEFLDETHKNLKFFKRGVAAALTYSDSIEQVIKREGRIATLKKVEDLEDCIEENLKNDKFKDERKKLNCELVAFQDGNCARRAKEEIQKLLDGVTRSKKGILYHTFINSENINSIVHKSNNKLINENNLLRMTLKEDENSNLNTLKLTVIVLVDRLSVKYLIQTVESFKYFESLNCRFILRVSDNVNIQQDYKNIKVEQAQDNRVLYEMLANSHNTAGKNEYVYFVKSGTILNLDVIKKMVIYHEVHRNMGSIVGPVDNFKQRDRNTNFDFIYSIFYKSINVNFMIGFDVHGIGTMDNVLFKLEFILPMLVRIGAVNNLYLKLGSFQFFTNYWTHGYLGSSLDTVMSVSNRDILSFAMLKGADDVNGKRKYISFVNYFVSSGKNPDMLSKFKTHIFLILIRIVYNFGKLYRKLN